MLAVLQRVIERQTEAEAHALSLEEELKLERNVHLTAECKDALGRQLQQLCNDLVKAGVDKDKIDKKPNYILVSL